MNTDPSTEQTRFENLIRTLEAELANAGAHLTNDAAARQAYVREIRAMTSTLREQAQRGAMTWARAAAQAQEARNIVMDLSRGRTSPVGVAIAEAMKLKGLTFNALIASKVLKRYGSAAHFDKLTMPQREAVYADIVESAGRSRAGVTGHMRSAAYAGRGLLGLSLALSVYTVATAEEKLPAAGRELAINGAGVAGGVTDGALAGLACGPGAPVCVTLGAFVGGALAAFGIVCVL